MVPVTGFYFALYNGRSVIIPVRSYVACAISFLFPLLRKANERIACMAAKLISFFSYTASFSLCEMANSKALPSV